MHFIIFFAAERHNRIYLLVDVYAVNEEFYGSPSRMKNIANWCNSGRFWWCTSIAGHNFCLKAYDNVSWFINQRPAVGGKFE